VRRGTKAGVSTPAPTAGARKFEAWHRGHETCNRRTVAKKGNVSTEEGLARTMAVEPHPVLGDVAGEVQ